MIITAAFYNGQSIAPKDITEDSVTVYQKWNTFHVFKGDALTGLELYKDMDQDLCWRTAKLLSVSLDASFADLH